MCPAPNSSNRMGIKLPKWTNLLLKKIEELTLYTIALNKEVEVLKAELAKGGK